MAVNRPDMRQDHVFAVVRVDRDYDPLPLDKVDRQIGILKILRSQNEAESEVERLNRVNAGKTVITTGASQGC